MKKIISLTACVLLFSFHADEKSATLKFNQRQYEAIKTNFIDAISKNDSIKIAISFLPGDNSKIIQMLDKQRNEIIQNGNFILQIDSVFNKK